MVVGEEEDHLDRLQWVHPHLVVVVVVWEEEEVLLKYDLYIYYKSKATLRNIGQKVSKIEHIRTLTFGKSVEKYYHDKRKENCTRCHVA